MSCSVRSFLRPPQGGPLSIPGLRYITKIAPTPSAAQILLSSFLLPAEQRSTVVLSVPPHPPHLFYFFPSFSLASSSATFRLRAGRDCISFLFFSTRVIWVSSTWLLFFCPLLCFLPQLLTRYHLCACLGGKKLLVKNFPARPKTQAPNHPPPSPPHIQSIETFLDSTTTTTTTLFPHTQRLS